MTTSVSDGGPPSSDGQTPVLPPVVSAQEWQQARADLLVEEKELTRSLDRLAARRRRLPAVRVETSYAFQGPDGPSTLLDLFGERRQLAVYQFMDVGPDGFCPGCTHLTRNVTDLATLAEEGVAWATVSEMPLEQMRGYWREQGWQVPFYSSRGTSFAADCGVEGGFLLSLFLRDGDDIYRTYSTTQRGVDRLLFVNNVLDLAPYGRQEDWEDSPEGWPQRPTYG
ncbi:MAG TPA: DUF899 family protein [Nocardioides sp.]|jgi:predicted dithiol-disulfide oxidoreductase (DUF899 family)|uniref:DUF899 family protein n=1 Tax=Nocardioides sp. TaxID=35761 RepID=UPI002E33C592|nr:DUF899 family protein [Nocardioides sp.]HEX3931668.1 DUF899 family protein [Nocardioides sp.]